MMLICLLVVCAARLSVCGSLQAVSFQKQATFPNSKPIPSTESSSSDIIFFPDGTRISSCTDAKLVNNTRCSPTDGKILFDGQCETILTQGPCPDGYWVVLNPLCQPECAKRQCPTHQLYYQNKCVSATEDNVCGPREILYVEYTGQVSCDCEPNVIYDHKLGRCIEEHSRGFCAFGQYVEQDQVGQLHCIVNPCKVDGLIQNPANGSCYIKEFAGRCNAENYSVKFRPDGTAACFTGVGTRNIFEVPALNSCPANSKRDHLNNCRKVFRIEPRSPFGFRIPTQHVNAYDYCPAGYRRYPNKTCKKPNSIFGK